LLAVIDLLLGCIVLFLGELRGVRVGLLLVQFVRIQLVLGLVKLILLLLFLLLLLLGLRGVEVVIVIGRRDVVAIPDEVFQRLGRRREVLGDGSRCWGGAERAAEPGRRGPSPASLPTRMRMRSHLCPAVGQPQTPARRCSPPGPQPLAAGVSVCWRRRPYSRHER
jgi:hypothetical protein